MSGSRVSRPGQVSQAGSCQARPDQTLRDADLAGKVLNLVANAKLDSVGSLAA